jgi:hypothetical protein
MLFRKRQKKLAENPRFGSAKPDPDKQIKTQSNINFKTVTKQIMFSLYLLKSHTMPRVHSGGMPFVKTLQLLFPA